MILLLLFCVVDAFSQRRVSGAVFHENNEPAMGTSIIEAQTSNRVAANFYGKFEIVTTTDTAELHFSFIGYEVQTLKITSDSIVTIKLVVDDELWSLFDVATFLIRHRIIGVNYDITNTMFGVSLSSGYDTGVPYLGWRHRNVRLFGCRLAYKVSAQTNFKGDFGFRGSVGLRSPTRHLSMFSLNYRHQDFSQSTDFQFQKVGFTVSAFLRSISADFFVKPALQSLNGDNNFGLTTGIQRNFWRSHNPNSRIELSAGYFSNYWTYSMSVRHFLTRRTALQVSYEKIDRFSFFNVGVRYIISKQVGSW